MGTSPLVSIVIPVYNGANYLRDSIDSALNQTYSNCEVIVVNDGSSDNGATENIALSFGDRVRYFRKENGGVATALNLAIREMKGDFFSWLSHDDLFLPDKIQSQVAFIAGRTDVVAYGNFEIIGSNAKQLGIRRERKIPSGLFKYYLVFSHPIHGCTTLIPKKILHVVGEFDESLRTIQDYDLWYRIAKHYEFVHQDAILARFRIHERQGSVTVRLECLREYSKFYRRCFEEIITAWDATCDLSMLTFCLRSAIAFNNIGCSELGSRATEMALTLLKSRQLPLRMSDMVWLSLFAFHYLKSVPEFMCKKMSRTNRK